MALLRQIVADGSALLREIDDFERFLGTNPRRERKQFLPFFARHPQLCAYLAFFNSAVRSATHIATEFSLWGDFTCDLLAGSIQIRRSYALNSRMPRKRVFFVRKRGAEIVTGEHGPSTGSPKLLTGCFVSAEKTVPTSCNETLARAI